MGYQENEYVEFYITQIIQDPKTTTHTIHPTTKFYITQIIQDPKTYRYYIMTNYKLVRKDLILLSIKEES